MNVTTTTTPAPWLAIASLALLVAGPACYQGVSFDADEAAGNGDGDGPGDGDGDGDGPGDGDGEASCERADALGGRSLRRLTRREFEATVRQVFDLDADTWSGSQLNFDPSHGGYNTNADALTIDETYAGNLLASAEAVADLLVAPQQLDSRLPCAAAGGLACANSFLDSYGTRLFRRPLAASERERWLAVFSEAEAAADFSTGIRWLTVGLLASPNFIYRHELGIADPSTPGEYRLAPHEVATALAYTYTGRGPEDWLIERAASGGLDTAAQIAATTRELALDEGGVVRSAFAATFLAFSDQWLGLAGLPNLQKDPVAVPGFGPEVRAAMLAETRAFLRHIVFEERGSVDDLLTAPITLLDGTLAAYYGYGAAAGPDFVETERPSEWGIGLLAQGSLLALSANNRATSPTNRGLMVQDKLLCFHPPPPPPGIAELPEPTPDMSTRERYEHHTGQDSCAGCHVFMDATGFALEGFDAGGRYRAMEGVHPIDDSAELHGHTPEPIVFEGPIELALTVAELERAGACVGRQVGAYSFGVAGTESACMVAEPAAALGRGELSLLDFWLALSETEHFTRRVD